MSKSASSSITASLPAELADKIRQMARDEERSISTVMSRLIRKGLEVSTEVLSPTQTAVEEGTLPNGSGAT